MYPNLLVSNCYFNLLEDHDFQRLIYKGLNILFALVGGHAHVASTCQDSLEEPTPKDEEVELGPVVAFLFDGLREEPMDSSHILVHVCLRVCTHIFVCI